MKSLRAKLLVSIFFILLITQSISALWLWHESEEQIELIAEKIHTSNLKNLKDIEEEIEEEVQEAIVALFLPSSICISLALLMIYIAVTRLTRPLKKLTQQIEERTPYNLKPLVGTNASTEIMLVTQTVNQLLARLEEGLENERRFTADVAHELRTPLAGVRLNLELLQQSGINDAQALIDRMDQMMASIEQLLQLSRVGQKLLEGKGKRFDLIAEVIAPAQIEWEDDPTSPYPLVIDAPSEVFIGGDSGLIYLLLRNLLENIRRYASEGSEAMIRITQKKNAVQLEVIDEGPGVSETKLPVLTQRYTRLDKTIKGHGLGLNIVNRIVLVHRAKLDISNRIDRPGLHIKILFSSV